jgi:hypothetical protein
VEAVSIRVYARGFFMSATSVIEPPTGEVPVKVAVAGDRLFSSRSGLAELAGANTVCIDLDECIAQDDLPQASKWLRDAMQHKKRVLIVGTSRSLRAANSLRRTGAFFMNRKSLAVAQREARGRELEQAVTEVFIQMYAPFEKTADGYVHRARRADSAVKKAVPPAPLRRAEKTYATEVMTPEQKGQFRAFMRRP